MTGSEVLILLALIVPLVVSIVLHREPTTVRVKWISIGWAAASFGIAMYIACHSQAIVGLILVAAPFAVAASAAHKHWFHPTPAKKPAGHCPNCGYGLAGNVSGVCPACGTPVRK